MFKVCFSAKCFLFVTQVFFCIVEVFKIEKKNKRRKRRKEGKLLINVGCVSCEKSYFPALLNWGYPDQRNFKFENLIVAGRTDG